MRLLTADGPDDAPVAMDESDEDDNQETGHEDSNGTDGSGDDEDRDDNGEAGQEDGVSEDEFVEMRTTRDKTLAMPELIMPSVQVNIRGGRLPEPEDNGVSYIKIPINTL